MEIILVLTLLSTLALLLTLIGYIVFNEVRLRRKTKKQKEVVKDQESKISDLQFQMTKMLNTKITLKRGMFKDLPRHASVGEPLYCIDNGLLCIGNGEGNPLTFYIPYTRKELTAKVEDPAFKELTIDIENNEVG